MKVDPRFMTGEGQEVFTGSELLLKGALEAEGGVHLLSGYPGSPVAGFFDGMTLLRDLLNEKGIRAVMSNNEALAAAMLNGSQMAACRGIIAMKSVGVHVAADGLALANLAGAHPQGGAIVIYGDDPWCDSTQVPADSRFISKHLFIPVVEPANPQEIKDYVDLCFKISSSAELYMGMVLTTNLADGGGSVVCKPNQYPAFNTRQKLSLETALQNLDKRVLLPPRTVWQEESFPARFERAMAAAKRLGMNRIDYPAKDPRPLGFITSGLAHGYLVQALFELGVLGQYPILKLGMTYPVDPSLVRQLAGQCRQIIVVEERRAFIEEQVNEIILKDRQLGQPAGQTELWGKQFPSGLKGIPALRGLHPSILIARLVPLLKLTHGQTGVASVSPAADGKENREQDARDTSGATSSAWDREVETIDATEQTDVGRLPLRYPTFCPGCPHRDSSDVCLEIQKKFLDASYMRRFHGQGPVDLVFHGDTGCYTMLMFPPTASLMHNYSGMGLGGGTGGGIDPFITNKQVVFMGDSTFFHSGQIAISQALKLGQDITFIILDNRTTGMTGHQPTPGVEYDILGNPTPSQDIGEIVRGIVAGNEVPVVRADPQQRKAYLQVLENTFLLPGLKVVIADKECGITRTRRRRRLERSEARRRGFLKTWQHMNINAEACTFCLACAEMTVCPGLRHVATDYGPKMDTDITWCVDDGACERIAACNAFERVVIHRKRPPRSRLPELGLDDIPEPQKRPPGDMWRCYLAGVGGMGIGVATSILVRAGHKEGYNVLFLDKKGLAIRNGGVNSQVVYNITNQPVTAIIPFGKADLLIGVDVLEAARAMDPANRTRIASRERTAAVVNTDKITTTTGLMGLEDFSVDALAAVIRQNTRQEDFLARDISRICEKYLGSKLYANIMMLGFAFQKGLIPVSKHSIAWAIKDTIATDHRKNLYAFNMGRKLVVQQDLFQGPPFRREWHDVLEDKCRSAARRYGKGRLIERFRQLAMSTIEQAKGLDESTRRDLVIRLYDCLRWGGLEYARRYAHDVLAIHARDDAAAGYAATRAVILALAGAMLIPDPFFLAETSTSPEKYARDREKYNVNPANGDRISYRHYWHFRSGSQSRQYDLAMPDWTLKLLKRLRFARKLLPGLCRDQREFLADYRRLLAGFAYSSGEEYRRQVEQLASPRCMHCLNPRCQEKGCPLGSDIPTWVNLAYHHRWEEACRLLHQANNFPEFTAAICPAPCQVACKQSASDRPVNIRQLELEIVERGFAAGALQPQKPARTSGRKVAIIGSGPAGLAAAQQLARAGHQVTVFEKDPAPGGLLRYGIPHFRLDKALIDRRIAQLQAEGVSFACGKTLGKDISAPELRRQFDALLIATGNAQPRDLNLPGRNLPGIHLALDYLRRHNLAAASGTPAPAELDARGKTVVVLGGGETGQDCVDIALAGGAREVYQLEILPQDSIATTTGYAAQAPAPSPDEPGKTAPVHKRYSVATQAFCADNGRLSRLRAVEVVWHHQAGKPAMTQKPGAEFELKADMALLALGYEPKADPVVLEQFGLQADARGRVAADDFATAQPGVFAAGDTAVGPSQVVRAIQTGRRAAERIDRYLKSL